MFLRQAVAVEELLLNYMIKVVESEWSFEGKMKAASEVGKSSSTTQKMERKEKKERRVIKRNRLEDRKKGSSGVKKANGSCRGY